MLMLPLTIMIVVPDNCLSVQQELGPGPSSASLRRTERIAVARARSTGAPYVVADRVVDAEVLIGAATAPGDPG
jgi:hypothetical protein